MVVLFIFIALFIIAIYKLILEAIPGFYNYLCLVAVIGVAMWLLSVIISLFIRPSIAQKRRIKEAAKKDADESAAIALRMASENSDIKKQIQSIRAELKTHEANVNSNPVLASSDKNLSTVKWITEQIESRRADSVKEALQLYDEKRRRDSAFELKMLQDKIESERRGREMIENATRELSETIARKNYEREMKRIEEKKLDELRDINEKLSR